MRIITIVLILSVLVSCQANSGTLTPDTTPVPTATSVAGTKGQTPTATPDAAPTVDTTIPVDDLPDQENSTRIQFAPDATSAELAGELSASDVEHYVLGAMAGQMLQLDLSTDPHSLADLKLVVREADGTVLAAGNITATQTSTLPTTQDYYISIQQTVQTSTPYRLEVTIPPLPDTTCPFTVETLRNGTYTVSDLNFQLVDGEASLPQLVPGPSDTYQSYARFLGVLGCGDLDGDGMNDAVVTLSIYTTNTTGRGIQLAAVLNLDGQPYNAATAPLGDRTNIWGYVIRPGEVEIDVETHGANSRSERWRFIYSGDTLFGCIEQFERRELYDGRNTVSKTELDAYLKKMGIQLPCIPLDFGAPLVIDQDGQQYELGTGRRITIDFESDQNIHISYITYDFSWPTEGTRFASSDDYLAVQNGTKENGIVINGTKGFVYIERFPLEYYGPAVIRAFVFPFQDAYIAVWQRVEFTSDLAMDQAIPHLIIPEAYPEEQRAYLELADRFVSTIEFQP